MTNNLYGGRNGLYDSPGGGFYGPPGGGGLYGRRKLTDEEKRDQRLATLQELAAEEGILGPKKRALLPKGLKTAFATVADILAKPNYAIAGVFDVLQNTGKPGETVGGRVIREIFTRQGDKELFGDVLEQGGVGEGGRLSDVINLPDVIERRWNPTLRGTVGLALDVVSTSWMGTVGGVTKIIGAGGEHLLSKAGLAYLEKAGRTQIGRRAMRLGVASSDEVAAAAKAGGEAWQAIEDATIKRMSESRFYKALGEQAETGIRLKIEREAQERTAQAIASGAEKGLTAKRYFGITSPFGLAGKGGIPLIPISAAEAPFKAVKTMTTALAHKIPGGDELIDHVRKFRNDFDQWFNRVGVMARRLPEYRAAEQENFFLRSGSRAVAESVVARAVFGPEVVKRFGKHFDSAEWHLLTQAADNPNAHLVEWIDTAVNKIGLEPKQANELVENWRRLARTMFDAEAHPSLGLIDPKLLRPDYIPHIYKNTDLSERMLQQLGIESNRFRGADLKNFAHARVVDTLDEAIALGLDPVMNPWELMVRRAQAHSNALADHQFGQRILAMQSKIEKLPADAALHHALPKTVEYLNGIKLTEKYKDELTDLMSRSSSIWGKKEAEDILKAEAARRNITVEALAVDDLKRLSNLPREAQAAFMYEVLSNVKSMVHLNSVIGKYGRVWSEIAPETLAEVRKSMIRWDAGTLFNNQRLQSVRVKLRGKEEIWDLPEGAAKDLQNWERRWLENPEVRGVLRAFDYASNTFKLWVTAMFPAFHARNIYSNVAASFTEIGLAALNPERHRAAISIMAGADGTLKIAGGRRMTYEALRKQLAALGITKRPDYWVQELVGSREAFRGGPGVSKVVKGFEKGGQLIEEEARALHYISLIQQGVPLQEAARRVRQFLFDYSDLSPTERGGFRRLFPFYTWQSKNVRQQVRNLLEQPGRVGLLIKPFNIGDRGPSPDMLPEYLRGELTVGLEPGQGKKAAFITNIDLPINNIDLLYKGDLDSTLRNVITQLNPLLKSPIEIASNMDSFTGRTIKGQQWMGRMGPTIRHLDKLMGGFLESSEDDQGRVKANGLKVYLLTKTWAVSRLINTAPDVEALIGGRLTDKDAGKRLEAWWRLTAGLQFREYGFDEAQKVAIDNQIKRLEEALLAKGVGYEFSRNVFPTKKQ